MDKFKMIYESEKKAMEWLKAKFGDKYNFKHNPFISDFDRNFYASVDGEEFTIKAKKYDTTGDGEPDTVVFKVELPVPEPKQEEF